MASNELEDASDEEQEFDPKSGNGNVLEDSSEDDEAGDDAAADGGEEEEEEEDVASPVKKKGRSGKSGGGRKRKAGGASKRRNMFIDDAAEEDDDEDEEDPGERRGKQKRSRYIDDMAAEDRDAEDEEEDEGEDDFEDIIAADTEADTTRGHNIHRIEERRRQQEEMTEEELEEFVRNKYERTAYTARDGDEDDKNVGIVGQQGLLPTAQDARLWAVQCRGGFEREAVVCIMTKAAEYAARNERLGMAALGIKAVFCQDHLPGYIWVEAHKADYVKDALRGFNFIFHSKPPRLVALGEMVDTITVPKPKEELLDHGAWVRVRTNAVYKGDIGRVVDVDHARRRATVELVPRMDYTAMAQARDRAAGGARVVHTRQPPRSFNPAEAKERGCTVVRSGGSMLREEAPSYTVDDRLTFRGGYLLKDFPVRSLTHLPGLPPMGELTAFKQAASGEDGEDPGGLSSLMQSLKGSSGAAITFVKGDKIRVVAGDFVGAWGFVEKVAENGTLHMRATSLDKDLILEVDPSEAVKHFVAGDRVKAVAGQFAGETGMLLVVDDAGVAVMMLDSSQAEAKLFARDLTLSKERNQGIDRLGQYEQHDLVQLVDCVGVIVECGADTAKVLTSGGRPDRPEIRTVRLPDIKKRAGSRNAVTNDLSLQPVAIGDIVDVKRGSMSDKSGTVKFIKANNLFLHSREVKTHGGFFCVNARDCRVRGGKAQTTGLGGSAWGATPGRVDHTQDILNALKSPGHGPNVLGSPQLGTANQMGLTGTSGGSFSGRAGGQQRDDGLVGRRLKICKGPHKGYTGRVISATQTHCRMELEAAMKHVTVARAQLNLGDGGATPGGTPSHSPWTTPTTPSHPGGRTPSHTGSATPMHAWGSQTPSHPGSATPSRVPMTPGRDTPGTAWGAMTPMRGAETPGTPGWGNDFNPGTGGFSSSPTDYPTPASQYGTPGTAAATPGTATPAFSPVGQYSPTDHHGSLGTSPTAQYSPSLDPHTPAFLGTPEDGGAYPYTQPMNHNSQPDHGASDLSTIWHGVGVVTPDGREGVVTDVDSTAVATISVGGGVMKEAVSSLAPVAPGRRDSVRVVLEAAPADAARDDASTRPGLSGVLSDITDAGAVVKVDTDGDDVVLVFLSLKRLGRLSK
mmetsp:Transcript_16448/g.49275  ORF Transcript_16448/g.49275 Transcript_16448/m.49275 type:complete len:1138 (+) Transcript_16448:204-3617(+)